MESFEEWVQGNPAISKLKSLAILLSLSYECQSWTSSHFGPLAHPHMFLIIKFEKWEVLNSFEAQIPSVFALIMVFRWFSSEPAFSECFSCKARPHKTYSGQFILVHLILYLLISWTSLVGLDLPSSGVSSACIFRIYVRIVPRPFPF